MTERQYKKKKTGSVSNFTPGENREQDGKKRERRERGENRACVRERDRETQ